MSKTFKDLKSYKTHIKYVKAKRKMKPLAVNGEEISGERTQLVDINNDISQEGFQRGEHFWNAKTVKAIRKQINRARQDEKSSARFKIKQQTKKDVNKELDGE